MDNSVPATTDKNRPAPPRKRVLHYLAPVLSVDLDAIDHEIWPCDECLPWHVEIVADTDGEITAREWHAADCPALEALFGNDE